MTSLTTGFPTRPLTGDSPSPYITIYSGRSEAYGKDYISLRLGSFGQEYTFRIDLVDTIRLIRHLQQAVDAQAPGAYFPQETEAEGADGLIVLDRADRRERGENV